VYPLERFDIAIIVPAYNESSTIEQVVNSVLGYGDVIVVNDASSDDTADKAGNAGAIVISHSYNRGYDNALNSGFAEADKRNYDAVITFDADGQHKSKLLTKYIAELKSGTDLVLGIRPKPARFSEYLFMYYTRYRFKWNDPLCGMKGYSMKLYRKRGYFDSMHSIGTELSLYGLVNGYSSVQVAIPVAKRQDKPRFSSIFRANILILKSLYNIYKVF
jgi:glycosyltransferase involved in cell wall biosynthesis